MNTKEVREAYKKHLKTADYIPLKVFKKVYYSKRKEVIKEKTEDIKQKIIDFTNWLEMYLNSDLVTTKSKEDLFLKIKQISIEKFELSIKDEYILKAIDRSFNIKDLGSTNKEVK